MNHISKYIGDVYGSKRGFLRHLACLVQDKLFNSYSKNKKLPGGVSRVVFVCKGNVCRSAVAEWSFKLNSGIDCCSVGLETTTGNSANDRIRDISRGYGISLDEHVTTDINDFSHLKGDLFVCMEPSQIKQLEEKIGAQSSILLGFFGSPQRAYIHDPYNSNIVFAEECIKYIASAVKQFSDRLPVELKSNNAKCG